MRNYGNRKLTWILLTQVTGLVSGMFHDIMVAFMDNLNFTIRYYNRFDEGWGSFDPESGEWGGMVRSLVDGEADMINSGLTISIERSNAVRFLPPIISDVYTFAIKRPDGKAINWLTLFNIFKPELWTVLVLVALLATLFKLGVFLVRSSKSKVLDNP